MLSDVIADIRSGSKLVGPMTREALWRVEHWLTPDNMIDECERILFETPARGH